MHNCYQEQISQTAQKIGGLSLGDGVNLVKALSKKNEESHILKELVPVVDRAKFKDIFGFDYDSLPAKSKGSWCVKYRRIISKTDFNAKSCYIIKTQVFAC